MASSPAHAFVVPAYGCSPHLESCLASLADQTLRSDIVLVTSTPFEGIEGIARRYGARLVVHSGEPGIGRDWNAALAQVASRWVTIAHQDDIYLPAFAELTLSAAGACPDATLLFTDYAELTGGHERARSPMLLIKRLLLELGFLGRTTIGSERDKTRVLRFGCPIPCPTVTLRPDMVSFREDLRVNLDWDAWLRLAGRAGPFVYIRRKLVLHRIHEDSETSAGVRAGARAREDAMMFAQLWPAPVARLLARWYALSYSTGGA